jgi:hypothetical protein
VYEVTVAWDFNGEEDSRHCTVFTMTRVIVYSAALVAFIAGKAFALFSSATENHKRD